MSTRVLNKKRVFLVQSKTRNRYWLDRRGPSATKGHKIQDVIFAGTSTDRDWFSLEMKWLSNSLTSSDAIWLMSKTFVSIFLGKGSLSDGREAITWSNVDLLPTRTTRDHLYWHFNPNTNQEYFENFVCKMPIILFKPYCWNIVSERLKSTSWEMDSNPWPFILTHWGRVTHICVSILTIICSDNGLSPSRRQAIIWTNVGIILIWPLETNLGEIQIGKQTFSNKKMHLKMSSAKWRPFCLGLNVLKGSSQVNHAWMNDGKVKSVVTQHEPIISIHQK